MRSIHSRCAVAACALAALLLSGAPCMAGGGGDTDQMIPMQAILRTASGQPVTGTVSVTFRMYDSFMSASPIWTETQTLSPANGLITTKLGAINPLPLPIDGNRFIGIQVNSDPEMTPRMSLGAVPFALALPGLTVNEQGGIGIGTANAFGLLDVACYLPISSGERLDQHSPGPMDTTQVTPGQTIWQSFRAGYTGSLTKIDLRMSGPTTPWSFVFRVYAGTGTGGTLLFQSTAAPNMSGTLLCVLNVSDVQLMAGYPYTFSITSTASSPFYVYYDRYFTYLHGESSIGGQHNLFFNTYVNTLSPALNHSLMVAKDRVGINTTTPAGALTILEPGGQWLEFRHEDETPDWRVIGYTDRLGFYSPYTAVMTMKPGPLVGIGTESPAYPLDIASSGQGVIRLQSRSADYGSVLELRNNTASAGTLGAINFVSANGSYVGQIAYQTQNALTFSTAGSERMRIASDGKVGIGTGSPQYALDVAGTIRANNVSPSDARLKTDIRALGEGLDTVLALRGVTYRWNRDGFPERNFPEGRQVGFIAQEVEKVLPEVVSTDGLGLKSLSYQSIIPVLVEAVKEQQRVIAEKDTQLAVQERRIQQLERDREATDARLRRLEQQWGNPSPSR